MRKVISRVKIGRELGEGFWTAWGEGRDAL